jgi:hypothetical protein
MPAGHWISAMAVSGLQDLCNVSQNTCESTNRLLQTFSTLSALGRNRLFRSSDSTAAALACRMTLNLARSPVGLCGAARRC